MDASTLLTILATHVAPPAIVLVGTLYTVRINYKTRIAELESDCQQAAEKNAQYEAELNNQREGLDLFEAVHEFEEIDDAIDAIIDDPSNCIDRVMFFRSHNGEFADRWTSSIREYRGAGQRSKAYNSVETDDHYRGLMGAMRTHGFVNILVSMLPECLIGGIYRKEALYASLWTHGFMLTYEGSAAKTYIYLSWATHEQREISEEERIEVMLVLSRIRALARLFYGERVVT